MDELDLNRDNNAAPLLDVERGSFPIGHAGSDWGKNWDASKGTHEQMTSRDVLSILGQYDARGDIPYDQIRCGPSVLLGAAIAQGPEALSSLIRQLGEPLAAPDSREMLWLALDKQRDKLRDIEFNWHHTPAPAPMTTSSPWTSCTGSSASCSYTFLRWSRWQSTRGSSRWTYRTPPRRTAGSSPPIYAAPRSG